MSKKKLRKSNKKSLKLPKLPLLNKAGAQGKRRRQLEKRWNRKTNLYGVQRVSTGIKNFDELIQGGFEKNSINLLAGDAGSGKTIFAMQFLVNGMNKGEKCLYVTFEEKKEEFYENMKVFGWDLWEFEKEGLFIFLEYTPIKVKTMLEEGGGTIESIILRNKISRIVIDSITSFTLLFKDELEKKEAALELFSLIRGWKCTSLLTLNEEHGSPIASLTTSLLEFESDSIILLYLILQKGERKKYLEIKKMRGTAHSRKIYQYEITSRGIEVNNRPVSNFKE